MKQSGITLGKLTVGLGLFLLVASIIIYGFSYTLHCN
jgi:hypothetical protein